MDAMSRLIRCLVICAALLHAQQPKKIVVMNDASLARELQSATPKARIVLATQSNVLGRLPMPTASWATSRPTRFTLRRS